MATRMQQRRGTAQQWTDANPVLAPGEIGFETDTNQFKIGDGVNLWSALSYFKNLEDLGGSLDDYVPLSTKGQAGGVASLDEDGLIPESQIPSLVGLDTEITTAVNNAITSIIDGAPAALNTLNELAAAINDDESYASTVLTGLNNKQDKVANVSDTEIGYLDGVQSSIQTQINNRLQTTVAESTYAPKASPTFTGIVILPEDTTIGAVTPTEISYLEGAGGNIQDQLNAFNLALPADIEAHADTTQSVHGISDTANLVYQSELTAHTSDTTSVHGISDTANLVYTSDLSSHTSDTTSVHGISDTANLVYTSDLEAHVDATTSVHGIADTANLAYLSDISGHASDTTNIHGITDTAELATKAFAASLLTGATKTNITITGDKNGLTIAAENGVADSTTTDLAEGTNLYFTDERAQDAVGNAVGNGLTYTDSTGEIKVDTTTIQARVTGVSDTEIGYLDGVTSKIQDQLNTKANSDSPTFTGTVSGVSKSMVGLGNVDNTSDANKPVSSATQTALNAKLNLSGGTLTGALTLSGAPTSDLHAATKAYVDNVTAGINFHEAVHAASTTNLATIYNNGTSGVGATLTADTNRAFATLDGESVALGQRVLIKNQTDAKQNGIYTLTTVGVTGTTPWVLTRANDADNNPSGEMKTGDFTFVQNGTVNAGIGYINNSPVNPITIGTDNITYVEFNAAKALVAGNGLTEATPGIISIDTSVTQTRVANVSDTEIGFLDGVTSSIQTQLNSKTPELYTFTTDATTARTLSLADNFASLRFTNAGAITVTVPTNASVAFPIGSYIELYQWSGQITVVAATPATTAIRSTDSQTKSRTTYSSMVLVKVGTDEWLLTGDLTA